MIPKEDPIIKEMSDVLRAWGDIWKKVYVVCGQCCMLGVGLTVYFMQEGSIQQYQDLTKLMRDILDWRRQILSQTLPRVSIVCQPDISILLLTMYQLLDEACYLCYYNAIAL